MSAQVEKRSGQWGMANLFRKKSKISARYWGKLAEIFFWQNIKQHDAQLMVLDQLMQIHQHF